jgi:hypothetical protein
VVRAERAGVPCGDGVRADCAMGWLCPGRLALGGWVSAVRLHRRAVAVVVDPGRQEVGNGGFSLRSRRLLEVLADEAFEVGHPEDVRICRTWRAELELRRVVFADPDTAARFSVEHGPGSERRFGFHGIFNFWRVVSEAELNGLFDIVSPAALGSSEAMDLVCCYVLRRRGAEARSVLDRYERVHGVDATVAALVEAAAVRGEVMWENLVALLGKRYPGLVG